jgi:hypothetical protein
MIPPGIGQLTVPSRRDGRARFYYWILLRLASLPVHLECWMPVMAAITLETPIKSRMTCNAFMRPHSVPVQFRLHNFPRHPGRTRVALDGLIQILDPLAQLPKLGFIHTHFPALKICRSTYGKIPPCL